MVRTSSALRQLCLPHPYNAKRNRLSTRKSIAPGNTSSQENRNKSMYHTIKKKATEMSNTIKWTIVALMPTMIRDMKSPSHASLFGVLKLSFIATYTIVARYSMNHAAAFVFIRNAKVHNHVFRGRRSLAAPETLHSSLNRKAAFRSNKNIITNNNNRSQLLLGPSFRSLPNCSTEEKDSPGCIEPSEEEESSKKRRRKKLNGRRIGRRYSTHEKNLQQRRQERDGTYDSIFDPSYRRDYPVSFVFKSGVSIFLSLGLLVMTYAVSSIFGIGY